MQRFITVQDDDGPPAVRALLERPPAVVEEGWRDAAIALFEADPQLEWVPVLASDSRPVALAGRPLGLGGEPVLAGIEHVEPDLGFAAAARLAMARVASERLVPFVRCDSHGRYVALVRIERVVTELAEEYGRRSGGCTAPHPTGF